MVLRQWFVQFRSEEMNCIELKIRCHLQLSNWCKNFKNSQLRINISPHSRKHDSVDKYPRWNNTNECWTNLSGTCPSYARVIQEGTMCNSENGILIYEIKCTRWNWSKKYWSSMKEEASQMKHGRTCSGMKNILWHGEHFVAWRTSCGMVNILWHGEQLVTWRTSCGMENILWHGEHFVASWTSVAYRTSCSIVCRTLSLILSNNKINKVYDTKFLGVIISYNLSWKQAHWRSS